MFVWPWLRSAHWLVLRVSQAKTGPFVYTIHRLVCITMAMGMAILLCASMMMQGFFVAIKKKRLFLEAT